MDINDAIELFLEYKAVEEGLNIKSTIPDYKDDFKVFLKYFPNIKTVDDLNDELIDNFIYEQSLNDLKSSTISRRISTIKNFFLFLENEKIATNLVKEVILPKKEKHIPTFLSIDEIKNLLSVFDETKPTEYRDKTMVLVMYSAGLRVSELINLEKKSINFEEKLITLKGKGNKERFVPLNYIALEYLNNYLSQNKNNKGLIILIDKSKINEILELLPMRRLALPIRDIPYPNSYCLWCNPSYIRLWTKLSALNRAWDMVRIYLRTKFTYIYMINII